MQMFIYTGTGVRLNCSIIVAEESLEAAVLTIKNELFSIGVKIDDDPDIEEIDMTKPGVVYMDYGG